MTQAAPLGGCGAALVAGNRNIHWLRGVTDSSLTGTQNWLHVPFRRDGQWRTQEFCSGGGGVQQIQLRTESTVIWWR